MTNSQKFVQKAFVRNVPKKGKFVLVADVGGTHCNFALVQKVRVKELRMLLKLSFSSKEIKDFSKWFQNSRTFSVDLPYLRYLGLFIRDGILFNNFVTEKHQSFFTKTRVLPAFRKLREVFGVSPLIVPIEPIETDSEPFWCYYPEEVRRFL